MSEDLEEEFVGEGCEGGVVRKHFCILFELIWLCAMSMCDGYYEIIRFV